VTVALARGVLFRWSKPTHQDEDAMTRLTSFSMLAASLACSWATWLLAGFSAGGMVMVLAQVITLVRQSDGFRRLTHRTHHVLARSLVAGRS
jgi:hypothetical protein